MAYCLERRLRQLEQKVRKDSAEIEVDGWVVVPYSLPPSEELQYMRAHGVRVGDTVIDYESIDSLA